MTIAGLAELIVPGAVIAYVGNSVTAQRDGYRERLHAKIVARAGGTVTAVNAGFGGVGAIGSLCMMDRMVTSHRPQLCFVECFTGDVGVGIHAMSGAAIEAILVKLSAIEAVPVLILLPRDGMHTDEAFALAALYRTIAAHHAVRLVDLLDRWDDLTPLVRDGVHTTPQGAELYADAIFAQIADNAFGPAGCITRMFAPDLSSAGAPSARPYMQGAAPDGLFRLQLPYWNVAAGATLSLTPLNEALLGLLVVQGPHAGTIVVKGQLQVLRDRWSHYERLHAPVFPQPLLPGPPIEIDVTDGTLRLIALLTYRVSPGPVHRPDPSGAP